MYSVYGIKRMATMGANLNFYHVFAEEEPRAKIKVDLQVMKAIHQAFTDDQVITLGEAPIVAENSGLAEGVVRSSLERLSALSDSVHLPYKKIFPFLQSQFKGDLRIGRKRVFIRL